MSPSFPKPSKGTSLRNSLYSRLQGDGCTFWGKSELLHKMQLSISPTWKGSRKDSGWRSCWQYSKISILWMTSVLANWENAWLQRRGAGSASSLPRQPHTERPLAGGKTPTRDCFCIKVRSQGWGKRGACDCGKTPSLQCLLTGGCCPAGPCDLPWLQSNQMEYLPSGSRNELLPLLPCWLDGKKKTNN